MWSIGKSEIYESVHGSKATLRITAERKTERAGERAWRKVYICLVQQS